MQANKSTNTVSLKMISDSTVSSSSASIATTEATAGYKGPRTLDPYVLNEKNNPFNIKYLHQRTRFPIKDSIVSDLIYGSIDSILQNEIPQDINESLSKFKILLSESAKKVDVKEKEFICMKGSGEVVIPRRKQPPNLDTLRSDSFKKDRATVTTKEDSKEDGDKQSTLTTENAANSFDLTKENVNIDEKSLTDQTSGEESADDDKNNNKLSNGKRIASGSVWSLKKWFLRRTS